MSREAAFLVNNWILLFSAFFVLFATMFPTLSEAVTGERLTVGPPFFNKWMVPIGLVLLLLTGIGPLLAWRKSTLINLRDQFLWPSAGSGRDGRDAGALGVRIWSSGLCFALCAFVSGTIVQEFWRGAKVRRRSTGTDLFTALVGLVGRNKRRYGGYIVHLGIVLIFLGFAGKGFKKRRADPLKLGEETTLGALHDSSRRLTVTDDGQKQMVTASPRGLRGRQADRHGVPGEMVVSTSTRTKRRRLKSGSAGRLREDLYIVLAPDFDLAAQSVSLQIFVNPLVNWIWLGFGVMAFGTGIALLPERTYCVRACQAARSGRDDASAARRSRSCSARPLLSAQHARPDSTGADDARQERARTAAAGGDRLHLWRRASTKR